MFAWKALGRMHHELEDLPSCTAALSTCDLPINTAGDARVRKRTNEVLITLLAHVLLGHVSEYRPLVSKMTKTRLNQLERILSANVRKGVINLSPQVARPNFHSWFDLTTQVSANNSALSLQDLHGFTHTKKWVVDEDTHRDKCRSYDRKAERSRVISNATTQRNSLKKTDNNNELDAVKNELKQLNVEEKLMIRRMRKYRIFPTREQRKKLHGFMGTCRWTYNQAVAHFRKTNVSRADVLRDLYVTKNTKKIREYPEGMDSPPEWVFDTPKNFRYNTLRKFETNIKSAFSNKRNGNINRFEIRFKSRKRDGRYFTFCEDGMNAQIVHREGHKHAFLSISNLKDILIRCDRNLEITNEIQITNSNGFWYAVIPQFVRPSNYVNEGKCIALDPGLKAFLTGVDLRGNAVHVGRNCRDHMGRIKNRISATQQTISTIKNKSGHRSGKEWKVFARAKRTFNSLTAKMKNCVKEMHYQACAYLTKHYDTIILPIFQTKDMVRRSSTRNHRFNESLLSLKHYQFRELLRAKCEVMGKSLVICSEMYTSMTCGSCDALHLKLGSSDVFQCPSCDYLAGRDLNAAFNILRFVCGGSLAVHKNY